MRKDIHLTPMDRIAQVSTLKCNACVYSTGPIKENLELYDISALV